MTEIQERWVMCKAADSHVILAEDSIDFPMTLPDGRRLMEVPHTAFNVKGAVGLPAEVFNSQGHQVRTGKLMKV